MSLLALVGSRGLSLALALSLTFALGIALPERSLRSVRLTPLLPGAASAPAAAAQSLHFPDRQVHRLEVCGVARAGLGLLRSLLLGAKQLLQARERVITRSVESGLALNLLAVHFDAGDEVGDLVASVL